MRRIILSLVTALALAGNALAQTTLPTAGQYYSPGTTIPTSAQGVEQVGIDSITSLRCMVGESTTCQVPTSGGGGGGGGGTSSTYGAAFPTTGTASGFKSSAGSTMQPGNLDGSGNILVSSTITGGSVGLLSGSQIVGKVGIDQTTPGTTNGVSLAQIGSAAPSITNPIWIANAEAADQTGTFTNATQTTSVTNSSADGYATALLSINGTYATASGVFEESDDSGTTWYGIICTRSDGTASETGYTTLTNTNRQWSCPVAGNDSVRVRSTAVATGTVNVRVGISAPTNNSGVVSVGAATPASVLSANSTNATVVKASAGTLYHSGLQNSSTSALAYIIYFNTATTPTCTATPYYGPVLIPYVGSTGNNGSGVIEDFGVGISFPTGIAYCITTAPAGTGSVAANAISGGLGYK